MIRLLTAIILVFGVVGCDEDDDMDTGNGPTSNCYDDGCTTREVPFTDSTDAPMLTNVTLECQSQSIVVLATATDPQGSANLQNVLQTIGVFPDEDCAGTPITVQDDFAGSGLEESFGDAFLASANQDLYDQICACNSWPVEVQLEDADQNTTSGRVVANVTR